MIKDASLVNVYTGEIQEGVDIAVKGSRIALVGRADHAIGSETKVADARGLYACPGFMDAHVHVESSMVTFTEFAKAVLPRGTTCIFADPHEIANVLGIDALKMIRMEIRGLPLKVYICVPSCVPASSPEFETSGAKLGLREIREALTWPETIALGEMMNYPGVLAGDRNVLAKIDAALRAGRVVEGHSDSLLGADLNAYAAAGISSCHESTRPEDVAERLRLGIYAMMREGSAWRDLGNCLKALTGLGLDSRRAIIVSDDRHLNDLLEEGHMDYIVRRAIEEGVDPVEAIQMATLNPAEHYGVDHLIGGIAPGRMADIVLLSDLEEVRVKEVYVNGTLIARDYKLLLEVKSRPYPKRARKTVKLPRSLTPSDFVIRVDKRGKAPVHVIQVYELSVLTKHLIEQVDVFDGEIRADPGRDLALAAVVERHGGSGRMGRGLVRGFGLKSGAIASTIAHDSHNLIVLGIRPEDMALAANEVAGAGGGIAVARDGRVIAKLELPIAGLITDEPAEAVSKKIKGVEEAWRELGCEMKSPFMTLSLISLSVLPEIRLTDRGLIDTVEFRKISIIAE
ncbi:MAG: adenine deaminase [Nitrososphaerota archaeon]|nr:adenine deaminase [Nitrososphaerota archaeon]